MGGPAVLIAGFSGRALAQSARRAGFRPLVVDAYGDADMRAAAHAFRTLPDAIARGFKRSSLTAALESLCRGEDPIGLVLGSGFEESPGLVGALAQRFKLFGCSADAIRAVKDPGRLFPALDALGVAYPVTRIAPPDRGEGWLTKRVGGSGGLHIARCRARVSASPRRYYQRQAAGTPVSLSGVVGDGEDMLVASAQWVAPMPRRPFRFGGAVGPVVLEQALTEELRRTTASIARASGVRGLCSFDFLVGKEGPLLLEVNPRPGATLDILDDREGRLFLAHVNHDLAPRLRSRATGPEDRGARAAAFLYADAGPLTLGQIDWPDWAADRPMPGTRIERWRPIATVLADGASAELARELCLERLGQLARVVYGQKNWEEPPR